MVRLWPWRSLVPVTGTAAGYLLKELTYSPGAIAVQRENVSGSSSIFHSRSAAIGVSQLDTTQADPSPAATNGGGWVTSAASSVTARPTAVAKLGMPTARTPI